MWMGESEYRILRLVNKKARLRPHHQATFICTEQVYSSLRSAGCGHILNQINANRAAIFGLPFCIAVKVCSEQTETLCAATRCFPVPPLYLGTMVILRPSMYKKVYYIFLKRDAIMKTIMVVLLLMMSSPLLADRPDCSFNPGDCRNGIPSGLVRGGKNVAVPEPGTLALIGLGAAGLVVARRRKR